MFSKVFIIGLGLIGGSLALDIREHKLSGKIVGYDSDQSNLNEAVRLGIIDEAAPLESVNQSDFIVLSVPVGQIPDVYKKIAPRLNDETIVVDTGSVKGYIINRINRIENSQCFVPCHPITGTENSGPSAAVPGLFKKKNVIITTEKKGSRIEKVSELWRSVGAAIVFMNAERHDEIFAAVSHLPHIAAYSLVDSVIVNGHLPRYIGGGLADYTRIAASSPSMWNDIFIYNKKNLTKSIEKYEKSLNRLKECIENERGVLEFLSTVRNAKLENVEDRQIIITVDGPSGVGKSSVSQRIAEKLDFLYIDSGALYRAKAIIKDIDEMQLKFRNSGGKWDLFYGNKSIEGDIRGEKAAIAASNIAKDSKIRENINGMIYRMVGKRSAVVEGRDAGTAIFPNADLKLFLDAPLEVRTKRRTKDDKSATKKQLSDRDMQDTGRAVSPLSMAADAVYLDTTASYDRVLKMINSVIRNTLKISIG